MKKRLLAMLMTGAMVASLAACGGGSSTPAGGDTQKDGGNKAGPTSGCSVDVIPVSYTHLSALYRNIYRCRRL